MKIDEIQRIAYELRDAALQAGIKTMIIAIASSAYRPYGDSEEPEAVFIKTEGDDEDIMSLLKDVALCETRSEYASVRR